VGFVVENRNSFKHLSRLSTNISGQLG